MNPECNNTYTHPGTGNSYMCNRPKEHSGHHARVAVSGNFIKSWPRTVVEQHPSMYAKGGYTPHPTPGTSIAQARAMAAAPEYPSYASVVDKEVQKIKDDMAKVTAKIEKTQAKIEKQLRKLEALEQTPVLLTLDDLKVIAYYMSSVDDEEDHEADVEAKAKIDAALKKML